MCGIAGYFGLKIIDRSIINDTLQLMKNRGPDKQAFAHFSFEIRNIYLLHSRLSIIDLDERSNQPLTIGDYTIVFNGEIYNYIELRGALKKRGIICHTNSDTEVLLRYYILHGQKCVEFFEGMWSFAIYDNCNKSLFLSRDRFAEKPLYYLKMDTDFYFGSEVKFVRSLYNKNLTINQRHILRYIINGYKSLYKTDHTFYNEIQEVPFSTNVVIDDKFCLKTNRFWFPCYNPKIMTFNEAIEGTKDKLLKSVKLRLRSDVPLAFCLSGGIDSSALASIASKIYNYNVATFTIIDPDERYNEFDNVKITVKDINAKAKFIHLKPKNNINRLIELIKYHDSPIATISYLLHSYISEAISSNGYKVAISGTGADEMLTGYYDHFNLFLYEMKNNSGFNDALHDWNHYVSTYVRNPYLKDPRLYIKDKNFRGHIYLNNDEFKSFLNIEFNEEFIENRYSESLLRNRMMNEMFHEGTRVILHEDDLNSMYFSIENRSPYLDRDLFEFTYTIPNSLLIKEGYGKYILRQAMNGILNEKVRLDRRKKGFNASLKSVINFNNKEDWDFLITDNPIYDLFQKEKILELTNRDPLPNSYSKFLFYFINAKIFIELNN